MVMLTAASLHALPLALYMTLSMVALFTFGLMMSNFTALAMEPQGHIAGTASSLYGSITTLVGIAVGVTLGQLYDGTLLPFAAGSLVCTLAAIGVVLVTERGRMFRLSR
jgi:DHA1 family bicyclomycin/chloramphenicol resistance-like MFS transporter